MPRLEPLVAIHAVKYRWTRWLSKAYVTIPAFSLDPLKDCCDLFGYLHIFYSPINEKFVTL